MQASGFPKNIQRDIVAGNVYLLGLNKGAIYGTQGRKHICYLMDHGSIQNNACHQLIDLIEPHNLEIWYTDMILYNNIPSLTKYVTTSWISHTWKFARDKNLTIEEATFQFQPQRQNDYSSWKNLWPQALKGNNYRSWTYASKTYVLPADPMSLRGMARQSLLTPGSARRIGRLTAISAPPPNQAPPIITGKLAGRSHAHL